ncbi:MAG: ArsA family ATPase [Actinomycetota bacterium]|nr:ArsA family ATPase [Actinomycetota bacterium]
MPGLLDRRLLFVTGKGGVGKTTVAAALGMLAAERGRRVLVCEGEPKGDVAAALESEAAGFAPREVAPRLSVMQMDTEASLREYLRLNLRVPTVGRIGPVARAFDFVANAAPGVREILTVGKLCYEVREGRYDLVVVDAAATGTIVGQLAAPVGINELVKVGAVRSQTRWMLDILEDGRTTGVCIVTTPEEMPVNEAVDLASRLEQETGVHLAALVANRVMPELFSRAEQEVFDTLSSRDVPDAVAAALGECSTDAVRSVLDAAELAVRIRRAGAAHLERLRGSLDRSVPLLYVPYLFGRAHGARAVRRVAGSLAEEIGG